MSASDNMAGSEVWLGQGKDVCCIEQRSRQVMRNMDVNINDVARCTIDDVNVHNVCLVPNCCVQV